MLPADQKTGLHTDWHKGEREGRRENFNQSQNWNQKFELRMSLPVLPEALLVPSVGPVGPVRHNDPINHHNKWLIAITIQSNLFCSKCLEWLLGIHYSGRVSWLGLPKAARRYSLLLLVAQLCSRMKNKKLSEKLPVQRHKITLIA